MLRVSAERKPEDRSAIHGVDIGEGENIFSVGIVVLQRNFDFHGAALPFM